MIIFYRKTTGEIVGTIEGRVHLEEQLGMWMGDKNEIDRIVVQWRAKISHPKYDSDYEPRSEQKDIMIEIDKDTRKIKNYKVDVKTKKLLLIH